MVDATAADGLLGNRPRDQCRERSQAMVRLASTRALVQVTGGVVTMLNQSRMRMKLEELERQQLSSL